MDVVSVVRLGVMDDAVCIFSESDETEILHWENSQLVCWSSGDLHQ